MSLAGGESLHKLLSSGPRACQEAVKVLLGSAIPLIGWLLLCKSSSDLAHVDPHPGNFRWDASSRTLWVLDWGSHVTLPAERRYALCLLIELVAGGSGAGNDDAIADAACSFGLKADSNHQL